MAKKAARKKAQGKKRKARPSSKQEPATRRSSDLTEELFPGLTRRKRSFGVGAYWSVVSAEGDGRQRRSGRYEQFSARPPKIADDLTGGHAAAAIELAKTLSALGHSHRILLLRAMFDGVTSYAMLRRRTGLKPGPMYHHLRELRIAGLLKDGPRDVYRPTELAENLFWTCWAVISPQKTKKS
jgi:DNA-binding HxlR family transcriptional regulator